MNKSTVFVACASDQNFVTPLVVTLKSLLTNFKNNRKIVIYILANDLKYFCRRRILKSLKMERADIRFVRVNDKLLKKMTLGRRITVAAYYRVLIPMVLPKELKKVIYLDSDLIVNTDIGKLWDLDIGQNYMLAVQEQGRSSLYVSSPLGLLNYKELGIDPFSKLFNSGVMLINLDRWRKDNISQKVIEYLEQNKEKVRWWDQDGLNAVLAGKWGEIDHRWNLVTQIFWNPSWKDGPIKDKEKYEELINHPYIVHFHTGSKPWHLMSRRHPHKYLFFHYLNMAKQSGWRINTRMQIIFLLMGLLKSEDIQLYYYKKIYRKKILSSKPIVCNNDSEFEVHILTCEKDFLDAVWCLKTLYHYSGVRPKLVIHEDGSLSIGNIKTFLKHFVNCRVIRRKDADEDLKHFLANYKYSQKNRLNKDFFGALKIFDAFYYAKADKLLLLDSDILFFKKPNEIIEYIKEDKPFFNSDYQDAYSKPVSELNKILGVSIFPKVNSGIMFLRKEYHFNNRDFIEYYFEKMEAIIQPRNINWHEQTLNALLLSKYGAIRLNENYQISKRPITDKTVCHHYVNDGSRKNFYKEGLKYLKSIKFLKEFNRVSHS